MKFEFIRGSYADFSCSIAAERRTASEERTGYQSVDHSLSLVGSVFFSCVSVCFSDFLSKVVTPDTSGLSPIAATFAVYTHRHIGRAQQTVSSCAADRQIFLPVFTEDQQERI